MADPGEHGCSQRRDRAPQALGVEGCQVRRRPASADQQDHVHADPVRRAQCCNEGFLRLRTLGACIDGCDVQADSASLELVQHVCLGRAPTGGDHRDPRRRERHGESGIGLQQAVRRKRRQGHRTALLGHCERVARIDAGHHQLELAARRVGLQLAGHPQHRALFDGHRTAVALDDRVHLLAVPPEQRHRQPGRSLLPLGSRLDELEVGVAGRTAVLGAQLPGDPDGLTEGVLDQPVEGDVQLLHRPRGLLGHGVGGASVSAGHCGRQARLVAERLRIPGRRGAGPAPAGWCGAPRTPTRTRSAPSTGSRGRAIRRRSHPRPSPRPHG